MNKQLRHNMLTHRTVTGLILLLLLASDLSAEDIVTIRTGAAGRESTRRLFGVVVESKGDKLTMLRNGREESFAASKVLRLETKYGDLHVAGKRQFEAKNYSAALASLRQAVEQDDRNWVRRDILAMLVACRYNLGQTDVACETFRIVYGSDKTTPHLRYIPLAWKSERATPALQQRAQGWLDSTDNAAARLMAASWLLSGAQRSRSMEVLDSLTADDDVRIAQLARAQLWRTKLVTSGEQDAAMWADAIRKMTPTTRGGAYFMLGQLYGRLKKHEQSVIAYMRTPVLFPHLRPVCEQSLLAAGKQLESMGRLTEARNVYRELINEYPRSLYLDDAQQRYQQLEVRRKK